MPTYNTKDFYPELNTLMTTAAEIRKSKGFDAPGPKNIDRKLLLVVSELCEAQTELRHGRRINEIYYPDAEEANGPPGPASKPEGFPIELADAVIRIADIAHANKINLAEVVAMKLGYNRTRPFQHGRNF